MILPLPFSGVTFAANSANTFRLPRNRQRIHAAPEQEIFFTPFPRFS